MTANPAPLRIAVPIHSFEPGGVERVALNLAEAWQQGGHHVAIILGRRDGAMAEHAPPLPYICRKAGFATAPVETLWMIYALWQFLRRNPVDVLFCAGNTYAIVGVAMRLVLGKRCPPIVLKVSNDLTRQDMSAVGRWGYRRWLSIQGASITRFVGMAEPLRQEIAAGTRIAASAITVIPDPALTDQQFSILSQGGCGGRTAGAHHFLAVGRLAEQKNLPLMIRAFAEGTPSHARLTILGDGPERSKIESLINRYGVAKRVRLIGYVPDTSHWFRSSTALLLSSHYEGVPAVIIEALAAGLPILATNCSSAMAHLLGHGRFGQLVPSGNAAAFTDALSTIDPARFDRKGAIESASDYVVSRAARRYIAVFEELAQQTVAPPIGAVPPLHPANLAPTQDPSHA